MSKNTEAPFDVDPAAELAAQLLAELPPEAHALAARAIACDDVELRGWMAGVEGPGPIRVRLTEQPADG
jgi:hypothetical protein